MEKKPMPPILIHYDNTANIRRPQNPLTIMVNPSPIRRYIMRSYMNNGTIHVNYVRSNDNLIDSLTNL